MESYFKLIRNFLCCVHTARWLLMVHVFVCVIASAVASELRGSVSVLGKVEGVAEFLPFVMMAKLDTLGSEIEPVSSVNTVSYSNLEKNTLNSLRRSEHWSSHSLNEYQVKASMLFHFLDYVEWPRQITDVHSPYVIAVFGAPEIAMALQQIVRDRSLRQRAIVIKTINVESDLADVHLLFINNKSSYTYQQRLLIKAAPYSIVTVTESDQGLSFGSIINLRLVDDRIGFDVSLVKAHALGLKLSARLLSVASHVETANK